MTQPQPTPAFPVHRDDYQKFLHDRDQEIARLLASLPRDSKDLVPYPALVGMFARWLDRPGFDRSGFRGQCWARDADLEYPAEGG